MLFLPANIITQLHYVTWVCLWVLACVRERAGGECSAPVFIGEREAGMPPWSRHHAKQLALALSHFDDIMTL